MIRGEKIELRGVGGYSETSTLAQLMEWRNLPEMRRWFREYRELTWGEHIEYWKSRANRKDECHFVVSTQTVNVFDPSVHDLKNPFTVIGYAGLTKIHPVNRTAEFGIYLAPEYQGKGFGKDALITLLRYGFEELNLNRIWAEVYAGNNALKLYQRIGFKQEGTLHEHVFKDGSYIDSYMIGLLRTEWDGFDE